MERRRSSWSSVASLQGKADTQHTGSYEAAVIKQHVIIIVIIIIIIIVINSIITDPS
jgi:t-SNARE complex subunit (syntaxin)